MQMKTCENNGNAKEDPWKTKEMQRNTNEKQQKYKGTHRKHTRNTQENFWKTIENTKEHNWNQSNSKGKQWFCVFQGLITIEITDQCCLNT